MYRLIEDMVRRETDDTSFVRGQGYLSEGRLHSVILFDDELRGFCMGSLGQKYEMRLRLDHSGIGDYRCSCPRGDYCKHLVALSLHLIYHSEEVLTFESDAVRRALEQRSKKELIELLLEEARADMRYARRLAEALRPRQPESATPFRGSESFEKQVARYTGLALESWQGVGLDPYREALECASVLQRLLMGAYRQTRGEPRDLLAYATGIYLALEERVLELDDSDGALRGVAYGCAESMLEAVESGSVAAQTQEEWLRRLLPKYLNDEIGLADALSEPLRRSVDSESIATAEEVVLEFLRGDASGEAQGQVDYPSSEWFRRFRVKRAVEYLAELLRRFGREEEIGRLYLEHELHFHYVMHCLAGGDAAAAVEHAASHLRGGHDLYRFAGALVDTGEIEGTRQLLKSVLPELESKTPYRDDLMELSARASERLGDLADAVEIRLRRFWERPGLETFKAAFRTARELGIGEEKEAEMIAYCGTEGPAARELVEIHIYRGDISAALAAFETIPSWGRDETALKLAAAAERRRPEASKRLIAEVVEHQIARRTRTHYAEAARAAQRLRPLLGEAGIAEYLSELRQEYNQLPALKDELRKAFG